MSEKIINQNLRNLLEFSKDNWSSARGLLSGLLLIFIATCLLFTAIDFSKIPTYGWCLIGILLFLVIIIWLRTRLPRVPKGKIGVGLALIVEDDEPSKKAFVDFKYKLNELLQFSALSHEFKFVELPQSICNNIKDNESLHDLARKVDLSILLFGRIFTRGASGKHSQYIDLNACVRHAPIDLSISKRLGQELRSALPARYDFLPDQSLPACEFAAQHVDAATKYIIGITATLCGDFKYAEELLLNAEILLKSYIKEAQPSPLLVLLERVQFQIKELYKNWIRHESKIYILKRNTASLTRCEPLIQKLHGRDGGDENTYTTSAICALVLHEDILKAKQEIDVQKGRRDSVYFYNKAFISAYEGDLDESYRLYSRAFNEPLPDATIPTQCEDFIQILLDKNPDKPWLYFCLGLINLRAKEDFFSAERDFSLFLSKADMTKYLAQEKAVKKWLAEIQEKISPKN